MPMCLFLDSELRMSWPHTEQALVLLTGDASQKLVGRRFDIVPFVVVS